MLRRYILFFLFFFFTDADPTSHRVSSLARRVLRPKGLLLLALFLRVRLHGCLEVTEMPLVPVGGRGEMPTAIFRRPWLSTGRRAVHQMLSLFLSCSVPTRKLRRAPPQSLKRYAVCSRVAFKVSPNLKHWGIPVVTGGRGADSCRSDGRAIAVGQGCGHGRARSPDIVDTVDPCDPGTDPRTGKGTVPRNGSSVRYPRNYFRSPAVTCPRSRRLP